MKYNKIPSNERSHTDCRFSRFISIRKALRIFPVLSAILMLANVGALAQVEVPFFLEDFEDGNATDGNPVTWVPGVPFASGSSGTVINGSYVLTQVAEGIQSTVWVQEFDSVGDVSIRARVRGQSPNRWPLSVFSRAQPDGQCYWAVLFQGRITLGSSWIHGANEITAVNLPAGINPWADDVLIQFDAVGTSLSATVWTPGSPKPSSPQVTATAPSSLPPGRVGFDSYAPQMTIGSFDAIRIGDSLPSSDEPPIISLQPQDQTVLAGEDVLLRVVAQGTDPLSYQWSRDGAMLEGETNATLAFPNFHYSMAGLYSVVVSNGFGAITSAPARLTVATSFFREDFEDGNATDGNPVTWVPGDPFAAGSSGTVINGSYVLTTTGNCGVEADESASIGDVSIRALVRGLSAGSGSWISVYAHGQPDGSSHWALVTQQGLHTGYTVGHNSPTVIGTVMNSAFNPFTGDVNIQFDVVGRDLSLTVWRPGSAKPSQPQLRSTVPTTLPAGRVGFGTSYLQIAVRSFDAIRIGDSVLPPPTLGIQLNPGIVIHGTEGMHHRVEWRDALTPDSPWQLLEDIPSLPAATHVVYDPTPVSATNRRFYQAVMVP